MPSDDIHIHTALISVYHKDETLERIIAILADKGVRLLSTGVPALGYSNAAIGAML